MNLLDEVTLEGLNAFIAEKREAALQEAKTSTYEISYGRRKRYGYVRSRGTFLCTESDRGQCNPNPEAGAISWHGTLKQIRALIAEVEADYPEVTRIYIAGGYDGAESPYAYWQLDDYEPWIAAWDETVWTRH